MLVPVVAFPVAVVAPLRRSSRQAQADGGGKRRPRRDEGARFEVGERRDAPSGDRAAALSSPAVLSALLDLPRGG